MQDQLDGSFEEEAAAMANSPTLWSMLHRIAHGCAGYLATGALPKPANASPTAVSSDFDRLL